jgi:hypothetical protein
MKGLERELMDVDWCYLQKKNKMISNGVLVISINNRNGYRTEEEKIHKF